MVGDKQGLGPGKNEVLQEKSAESGPEGRRLECCILLGEEGRTYCPSTHCINAAGGLSDQCRGWLPGTGFSLTCRTTRTPVRPVMTSQSPTYSPM